MVVACDMVGGKIKGRTTQLKNSSMKSHWSGSMKKPTFDREREAAAAQKFLDCTIVALSIYGMQCKTILLDGYY